MRVLGDVGALEWNVFGFPVDFIGVVGTFGSVEHTLEIKGGPVWKVPKIFRNGNVFVFQQVEDGFGRFVNSTRKLVPDFGFAGLLVTTMVLCPLEVFATAATTKRFGIRFEVVDERKVFLVKIEVECTGKLTKRPEHGLSHHLSLFVFGAGRFERVDKDVDLEQFFQVGQVVQGHATEFVQLGMLLTVPTRYG